MSNFHLLKAAVENRFLNMSKNGAQLYQVEIPLDEDLKNSRDSLVAVYLNSFKDPIERQYHNCACCKHFLRNYGNIVTIDNGEILTLWDVSVEDIQLQKAANALNEYVKNQPIENIFLTDIKNLGTNFNIDKKLNKWQHFYLEAPSKNITKTLYLGDKLNLSRTLIEVFLRSLREISLEACETVLELIENNSLYKGQEFENSIRSFLTHKLTFDKIALDNTDLDLSFLIRLQENYAWSNINTAFKIRNTSIGTLLVDISNGVPLETAVLKYRKIVDPENYMRSKSPITSKMIDNAKSKVKELGLEQSLERRYAVDSDIPVEHVLFVDRSFNNNDVFENLKNEILIQPKTLKNAKSISLETFINEIIPKSKEIELLLEERLSNKFMTLTTATNNEAPSLFKWNNSLAWAYNGNVTDSLKERVSIAGGKLSGVLCCRLGWGYSDDLDFHMLEPSGYEIYFNNLRKYSPDGGILDLDANGRDGPREFPIENIVYDNTTKLKEGIYTLMVNNFSRNSNGKDFTVEVEFNNEVHTFNYSGVLQEKQKIIIAKIQYSKENGFTIIESLNSASKISSKEIWNIGTNKFHKVKLITNSPNYLDINSVGNKHIFFILENAKSPEPVRGFFNEYLKSELLEHRKVFEILADNLKVKDANEQLAGLGFSTTLPANFYIKVNNDTNQTYKVII